MGGIFELTYCDLRCKEIVNAVDGKKLGRILDIIFSPMGEIRGIVAPYGKRGLFFKTQEIFIPWKRIKKIGEDIILVELMDGHHHEHRDRKSRDKYFDYDDRPSHSSHFDDCKDGIGDDYDLHHSNDKKNEHYEHKDFDCDRRSNNESYRDKHCDHGRGHGKEHESHFEHDKDCDCPPNYRHGSEQHHDKGREHDKGQEFHSDCGRGHGPDCDRRCEKCMLFDCIHRWREGEGIFVDNKKI